MASIDDQVLRTAKEIIVKFIETGRVSPAGFPEAFHSAYQAVNATVKEALDAGEAGEVQAAEGADPAKKSPKRKTASK
jgi:hypothetical protein